MKIFGKRPVAVIVMVLAIAAGLLIGQLRRPTDVSEPSTAVVGTYTYVYDHASVLSDETMEHIDAMNASLFAQTGAQILVVTVDSTGGQDIISYGEDLGNQYQVGDYRRNNGLVLLLALENISQGGLVGDYAEVPGTGLHSQDAELQQILYENMEADFAAGNYDAAVAKTFDAFIDWFSAYYDVSIQENYIPPVRENYSTGGGYYTESSGTFAPEPNVMVADMVSLVVMLFIVWVIVDGIRWGRYRRRYLRPGMGIPTTVYYPIFWGRPRRPPRRPPPPPRRPGPPPPRRPGPPPPGGGGAFRGGAGGTRPPRRPASGGFGGGGSFGGRAGGSRGSFGGRAGGSRGGSRGGRR